MCSLPGAGAGTGVVTVCWLYFITLASFSRIWNLSKAAVKYVRVLFRLWKNPPGTSVHLSLQDSIKPFCNSPEECYVPLVGIQVGLEKHPASLLCFLFKAPSDAYLSSYQTTISPKRELFFFYPSFLKILCCKISMEGLNTLSPSWLCLW